MWFGLIMFFRFFVFFPRQAYWTIKVVWNKCTYKSFCQIWDTTRFQGMKVAQLPWWRSKHVWSPGLPKISEPLTINIHDMKRRQCCLDNSNKRNHPTSTYASRISTSVWTPALPLPNYTVLGKLIHLSEPRSCLFCKMGIIPHLCRVVDTTFARF